MNYITILGLVAACFGTISFIPQVVKVYKTKSTKDISLGSYFLLSVTSILWTSYGVLMRDLPIITANSIILVLFINFLPENQIRIVMMERVDLNESSS